jgi:hypothetical protein
VMNIQRTTVCRKLTAGLSEIPIRNFKGRSFF